MPRRAAFLDRDGTLIFDPGYLADPEKVVLLEGAAESVALLRRAGYLPIIISNQSGVARGMYDESAVAAVNKRLCELLVAAHPLALIDAIYYCPHGPDDDCPCRKPRPGLFLRAAEEKGIDLPASLSIGDNPRDVEAALGAGVTRALRIGPPPCPPSLYAATTLLLGPASMC